METELVATAHILEGFDHSLESGFPVETGKALHYSIRNGYHAGFAGHAISLVGHQVPYGEESLLLVYLEHSLHHIVHPGGLYYAEQGHFSPVGIPERESGVIVEIRFRVYLVVGTAVAAIHVVEERRGYNRVVECGVELLFGNRIGLDAYAGEFPVPGIAGGAADLVEIPAGNLGLEVHPGSIRTDGGKTDLDKHLLTFGGAETRPREHPLLLFAIIVRRLDVFHFHRLRELGIEVDALVLCPALREAPAADGIAADGLGIGLGGMVPVAAVL